MSLLDHNGKPFPEKKLEEMQTSDKALYGALPKVFDTLKSITPQRVAALFKSAEEGDLVGQHALFSEMEEKDAHLFTEISKRKRAVLAIEWQVSEPENASAAEKKAAKDVQAMLKNLMDFEDLCFDLLDGIGHGFANVELSWARVNKEWRVSEFNHRPHGWFTTDEETRSKFLLKTSTGNVEPLQPCGWISHVHKPKVAMLRGAACIVCWFGRICLSISALATGLSFWKLTVCRFVSVSILSAQPPKKNAPCLQQCRHWGAMRLPSCPILC